MNENVKRIAKSRLWIALLIVTACGLAAGLYACFTRIPGSTARIVCAVAVIAITAPSIFGYAKIRSNTAPYKGAIVLGGMHRFLFIIGIIGALAGLILFFELLVIPSAIFLPPVSLLPIWVAYWNGTCTICIATWHHDSARAITPPCTSLAEQRYWWLCIWSSASF